MRKVIVNLATNRHVVGQARLRETLARVGYDGDMLFYTSEGDMGAEPHLQNPYAFKIQGFRRAIEAGYELILWLDASVTARKSVQPVFDIIQNAGYVMQQAGWQVGTWANDACLNYFGITRDEAMTMEMYGNAGFLGLNVHNPLAMEFLNLWEASAKAGMFKGAWTNANNSESADPRCRGHRHDMSCGSIIANKLGMNKNYLRGDEWLEYNAPGAHPRNETIIFQAQGV
jgi:hypothetical protein